MTENTQLYGDYIAVGAQYTAYIYPLGNIEKIKSICSYYSVWALIDDQFFDNSVDLVDIFAKIKDFKGALNEETDIDKLFFPIANFCSEVCWSKEAKEIFKLESIKYLDEVLFQRTIEVERQQVSLEDIWNAGLTM